MAKDKVTPSVSLKSQAVGGVFDTTRYNNMMEEIVRDITDISQKLNVVLSITNGLPRVEDGDSYPDATEGLDGTRMFLSNEANETNISQAMQRYYLDKANGRPTTIETALARVIEDFASLSNNLRVAAGQISQQISEEVQPSTLDFVTVMNNIRRIYNDLYKEGDALMVGTSTPVLSRNVQEAAFDGSGSLQDSVDTIQSTMAVVPLPQIDTATSTTVDETRDLTIPPENIQDELNEIRTILRVITGGGDWKNVPTQTLSDPSLKQHTDYKGSGVQSQHNPHALEVQTEYDNGNIVLVPEFAALERDFEILNECHTMYTKKSYNADGKLLEMEIYDSDLNDPNKNLLYHKVITYYETGTWDKFIQSVIVTIDQVSWISQYIYDGNPTGVYNVVIETTEES